MNYIANGLAIAHVKASRGSIRWNRQYGITSLPLCTRLSYVFVAV